MKIILSLFFFGLLIGCETPVSMTTCNTLKGTSEYIPCASRAGDKDAQYQMGLNYHNSGDTKNALKWLKEAARVKYNTASIPTKNPFNNNNTNIVRMKTGVEKAGHNGAQMLLAEIYEKGLGVKVNKKRAEYYRNINNNIGT